MELTKAQKTILFILTVVLVISITVAAWAVAKWGFARSSVPNPASGITVADSAEVKVAPDTAFVTFGVITKKNIARDAASLNAQKTSFVIAAINKLGIPKKDIKTIDYSLEPEMNWKINPPPIVGYTASNSVQVRTKELTKIGDMVDAAINAGANNVSGIRFDVEDKKKLRQKALGLAVKKAEGKAQAIAKALGAKLGPAISASESVDFDYGGSRNYNVMYRMASPAAPSMRTPIQPGETTVSARVKVVYSVR